MTDQERDRLLLNLRDRLERIEAKVDRVDTKVDDIDNRVSDMRRELGEEGLLPPVDEDHEDPPNLRVHGK